MDPARATHQVKGLDWETRLVMGSAMEKHQVKGSDWETHQVMGSARVMHQVKGSARELESPLEMRWDLVGRLWHRQTHSHSS